MRLEKVNISTVTCDMLWVRCDNIMGVNSCIALIMFNANTMNNYAAYFPCVQMANIDSDDLIYKLAYIGIEPVIIGINTEHSLYIEGMESVCDINEIVPLVKSTIRRFSANKK
jgi:hypothetical protein